MWCVVRLGLASGAMVTEDPWVKRIWLHAVKRNKLRVVLPRPFRIMDDKSE